MYLINLDIPYAEDKAYTNKIYNSSSTNFVKHPKYIGMERPYCRCTDQEYIPYEPRRSYEIHECTNRV